MIPQETKVPWYFKRRNIILILICIAPLSPLALPLVFLTPQLSSRQKIVWSVVTAVLTLIVFKYSVDFIHTMNGRMAALKTMGLY